MSFQNLSVGKRIAMTVAVMVVLFIAMAAAALLSLQRVQEAMNDFALSVEEGNHIKHIQQDLINMVAVSNQYLSSFDSELYSQLETTSEKLKDDFVETKNNSTDPRRQVMLRETQGYFQDYIAGVAEVRRLKEDQDRVYDEELQPRIEKLFNELNASMDAARAQGDIGTSFQTSFALQNLFESQASLNEFLLTSDPEKAEKSKASFNITKNQLKEIVGALEDTAAFDESLVDMDKLAVLQGLLKETDVYLSEYDILVSDALNIVEVKNGTLEEISPNFRKQVGLLEESISKYQKGVHEVSEATNRTAVITLTSLAIFGFVLCSIIGFWVIKSITKRIQNVAQSLHVSSQETNNASGQVMNSSKLLAEGASEQAASLEETSASLEEMASMTRSNAESAEQAKDIAGQTRNAAEAGASDMEEMTQAMNAIKDSSDNIAKIIRTIDEIAFQTNLLALNAAVEAARAGEAGMGFAVVADEVRSLAHRSAEAARETAVKIEDSLEKSERGFEISQKVARSLGEIVGRAREVDGLVVQIASSSQEQSTGIEQVGKAVSEIDARTQENASTAEETSSASFVLNEQARNLETAVNDLLSLVGMGSSDFGSNQVPVAQEKVFDKGSDSFFGGKSSKKNENNYKSVGDTSDLTFHDTDDWSESNNSSKDELTFR